jgi:hypothetical protein
MIAVFQFNGRALTAHVPAGSRVTFEGDEIYLTRGAYKTHIGLRIDDVRGIAEVVELDDPEPAHA